jgi:DEAD/DEAH box helicase domain-containing protein
MIEVFFDLETKKLFYEIDSKDPAELGVSVVSVYQREIDKNGQERTGTMKSFWEKDFASMWKLFQDADRIIGFNTLKFDVLALQSYTPIVLSKLPHFDIMDEVKKILGHRLSLNALAQACLQCKKTDVGTNAVVYWNRGDEESLKKLQKYCESDVLLTRDLYDFALREKVLKYTDKWNNPRVMEVDFSYPPILQASGKQTSLF